MKSIKGTGRIARNVETSSEKMNSKTRLRIEEIAHIIKRRIHYSTLKAHIGKKNRMQDEVKKRVKTM